MNISSIENFLKNQNLDIRRKGNNPRFLDQKCTPDVISFIVDMILDFDQMPFSRIKIQEKNNFGKLATFVFGKPSSKNSNLKNEYDKFIGQILELLSYAGILVKSKKGRSNVYKISEKEILEYISIRPMNAYHFLIAYFNEFLKDSGFNEFKTFFQNQTKENFELLKDSFEVFILKYSNIGSRGSATGGSTEIRRIFPKILNPLALENSSRGTFRGHLSKGIITSSELMYNRVNFRDKNKLKNISRKEKEKIKRIDGYNNYQLTKAKQWIKRLHPNSEINDNLYGKTADAHHIFPRSQFPIIADYIENIIALTGGQHKDKAHPNGNTQKIDISYQFVCLKAKLKTIQDFIKDSDSCYSKDNFIYVLNTGFKWLNTSKAIELKSKFEVIEQNINLYYKNFGS
ncbi:MAG: hypothetical protein JJV93_01830 [Alphaproteobacteria bacterium]|nr:hypothetical protein [Alphaproteobacteria bacterium]